MGVAPLVENALPVLMDDEAAPVDSKLEPPCASLHAAAATVQTRLAIPTKDKRITVNPPVRVLRAHGEAAPARPGVIT
jgi:hypothetical protein